MGCTTIELISNAAENVAATIFEIFDIRKSEYTRSLGGGGLSMFLNKLYRISTNKCFRLCSSPVRNI